MKIGNVTFDEKVNLYELCFKYKNYINSDKERNVIVEYEYVVQNLIRSGNKANNGKYSGYINEMLLKFRNQNDILKTKMFI